MSQDELMELMDAVKASPTNLPLRKLLARKLLSLGKYAEAEAEYKEALSLSPGDVSIKINLAEVFLMQNKTSAGLVLVEDILDSVEAPPVVIYQLYAKLLLKNNQIEEANDAYEKAVIVDVSLRDEDFEEQLEEAAKESGQERLVKLTHLGEEGQHDEAGRRVVDMERPKIGFDDIGGLEDLKEEIRLKIVHPLKHPEIYEAYGKKIGGGILMYGAPGCGKTHIARATAGEVNAAFISVGISDILDMYIGNSERNLHAIFQQARNSAPCVLFFDEVDALGADRSDMRNSAGRHIINQFLNELDGIEYSNEGVLVLAATNAPWHLDPAFRRPGRFDRLIFVPPPDLQARSEIVQMHLRNKPVEAIDFLSIAKKTREYSGADLQAIVDIAIEGKLADSMKTGVPQPIRQKDLLNAVDKQVPTTRDWFSKAKNYAIYANDSGLYDDVLKYLNIKK